MYVEQSMTGHIVMVDAMDLLMLISLLAFVKTHIYNFVNDQLIFLKFEKSNRDTLILKFTIHLWDSSSDRQQKSMGSYLYKHTDGDQIHLHTLHRYI